MSKIPTGPEPIELGQQNVFRRDKWNGDIRKPAARNTDSAVEFDQVPAKVGQNVNVVGEARLTECCAGPRTTDRIANSGRFERRTQRSESLPGGHHSRRYALRAGSGPNLVTAMRKLISVSSAPGYLWRAAARCRESQASQRATPMLMRSAGESRLHVLSGKCLSAPWPSDYPSQRLMKL